MSAITIDCPYCGAASSSFNLVGNYNSLVRHHSWFVLAECGVCKEVALAELHDLDLLCHSTQISVSPIDFGKKNALTERFVTKNFDPQPEKPRIARGIPENVEVVMIEGEAAFASGLYGAAAGCYRKACERAVKYLQPESKGTLNSRIREIEKLGLMPKAMIGLLDEVRLFGNAAMHDEEFDPNREDCEAARDFIHLFLTYAFSLPKMIAEAKEAASEG